MTEDRKSEIERKVLYTHIDSIMEILEECEDTHIQFLLGVEIGKLCASLIEELNKEVKLQESEGGTQHESVKEITELNNIVAIKHAIEQYQLKVYVKDCKIYLKNDMNERVEIGNIEYGDWIANDEVDENGNRHYRCSKCGRVDSRVGLQEVRYCWWCGRRMLGGVGQEGIMDEGD